jgi:photosystem II stability/assembly factor-like uncharacterized protein
MPTPRHVSATSGDALVLVGTMKGVFVLRSNASRRRWDVGGPYFAGNAVYALAYDGRDGRRRIWAGSGSEHWGPTLSSSDDFGRTWNTPEAARVRFPEDTGAAVKRIWQVRPGRADEPGTIYCGVEPAALFQSRDGGESWSLVRGLYDHPHRPRWQPGGGGLCLHTIVPDAANRRRLFVAISTGGVYRSDDDGDTWQPRNVGVRAEFLPDKYPEFGQCVHKIAQHPARPERLYLQNHWGLYRSDDGGDSWQDMARGVPSDFGFPMVVHPHDPETAYIVPLESDEFRCTPEGRLRVYRTRDGGRSWEALTRGLPQKNALETVLRDALDADDMNPAGIYVGTRSGQLWCSPNGGAAWLLALSGLPPIVCVKAYRVGGAAPRRAGGAKAKRASGAKSKRASGARKTARPRARAAARLAKPAKARAKRK